MFHSLGATAANLLAAWAAGSLIGAERTYNGRAAGFRTHALVGLAAAAAMTTAMGLPTPTPMAFPAGDATRVVQGVMTGVGFLGAGVIFKEGVSVQGLTTAACIWATAAAGLLFGAGQFGPGGVVTAVILVTLIGLRLVEGLLPGPIYVLCTFRFRAEAAPDEAGLAALLGEHVRLFDVSTAMTQGGAMIEHRGSLRVRRLLKFSALTDRVRGLAGLVEFDLTRIGK